MARPRTLALLRARTPGAVARGGVLATAMLSLRCEDDPRVCPITWWSSDPTSLEAPCRPPEGYEDAVRDRIGTGFWGYALGCNGGDDEDDCSCSADALAAAGSFEVAIRSARGEDEDFAQVAIHRDGTFELDAAPGLEYSFTGAIEVVVIDPSGASSVSDGIGPFVLSVGEILQIRVVVIESC